jgi:hypothetical protein
VRELFKGIDTNRFSEARSWSEIDLKAAVGAFAELDVVLDVDRDGKVVHWLEMVGDEAEVAIGWNEWKNFFVLLLFLLKKRENTYLGVNICKGLRFYEIELRFLRMKF